MLGNHMRSKKKESETRFLSSRKMVVCLLSKLSTIELSTFFLPARHCTCEPREKLKEKKLRNRGEKIEGAKSFSPHAL